MGASPAFSCSSFSILLLLFLSSTFCSMVMSLSSFSSAQTSGVVLVCLLLWSWAASTPCISDWTSVFLFSSSVRMVSPLVTTPLSPWAHVQCRQSSSTRKAAAPLILKYSLFKQFDTSRSVPPVIYTESWSLHCCMRINQVSLITNVNI